MRFTNRLTCLATVRRTPPEFYMTDRPLALIDKVQAAILLVAFCLQGVRVFARRSLSRQVVRCAVGVLLATIVLMSQAQACTVTIDGVTASPANVSVNGLVVIGVSLSYQGCQSTAITVRDNNPTPTLAYNAVCSASNGDWSCANVTTAAGVTSTTFTPGNNGNRSTSFNLSYQANSAGSFAFNYTNNISGSSSGVTVTVPSQLLAEWRMDESTTYAGVAGEVKNSVGGGANGTATDGAANTPGKLCRAVSFDGTNDFLTVAGLSSQLSGTASLSFWINTTQVGSDTAWSAPGVTGVELNGGTNDIFWGFINATGRIAVQKGDTLGAQSTSAINNGTWRHIALTRNQATGETQIFVDGVLNNTRNSEPGIVTTAFTSVGRMLNTPAFLRGALDEVKIFSAVLSNSQVSSIFANESAGKNWDGSPRVCPIYGPRHLEIVHPTGTGLTCAASTLTVRACADALVPCTPFTGGVAGTLTATGTPVVSWDGTTGGAIGAGFVIPAGSSSVTKNVQVSTVGSVVFGITTPTTPAASNATTCSFGSPQCTFTASAAGFLFSSTPMGTTSTLPAQVSGLATGTLYLRAVQAATTNAAVCTPAIISQSNVAVDMSYACNNPTTCQAGSLATINTTAISTSPTSVNLNFDANASAPITVRYDDVGQITVSARKSITPPNGTAVVLNGSTNAFVVAPHRFGVSGVTAAPIRAGRDFAAAVTAFNALPTPTPTRNFGKETAPEGVTLGFTRCQPTGAGTSAGSFNGSLGGFNAGVANASNLNWSEVGNGDLVATLSSGSYLGSGLTASGTTGASGVACGSGGAGAGSVGRFIPNHFETAVALAAGVPMPCPTGLTCPASNNGVVNGFVYSGQPFSVVVTAKNALTPPITTVNYQYSATPANSFAKDVALVAISAAGGAILPATTPGGLLSAGTAAATGFLLGTNAGAPARPSFTLASAALPTPPANVPPANVFLRAVDADAVTSLQPVAANSVEGGVLVASGRIRMPNAYGSELLALPMTATVQYFNNASWVTSTTDSVTAFDTRLVSAGGNLVTAVRAGLAGGVTVRSPGLAPVASGVRVFNFNAPNLSGHVDASLNAPTYLPNAGARATFGIFKSPLIYRRENY